MLRLHYNHELRIMCELLLNCCNRNFVLYLTNIFWISLCFIKLFCTNGEAWYTSTLFPLQAKMSRVYLSHLWAFGFSGCFVHLWFFRGTCAKKSMNLATHILCECLVHLLWMFCTSSVDVLCILCGCSVHTSSFMTTSGWTN